MKFINRVKELETLTREYESNESSFVVLYGRRRVGKTTLINRFLSEHNDTLYFLVTEESESQNLSAFKKLVGDFIHNPLLEKADVNWEEVFVELLSYPTKTKKIIVIDEFQYLGKANQAFPSILQKIWDMRLKEANIMLILAGSLISLMKSQTLDYSSPLYGRRTSQIKLKQIPFRNYHEFYEGKTSDELVEFYALTGGVPKYIEMFQGYSDIFQAIKEKVLNSQSFLYDEPFFLLQKEVSEIGSYFSLIKTIAFGSHKLSEIAAKVGIKQTSLSKYLKVLIDLDLIEREVPVTESQPEKSKSGLYFIKDNFIAFWFKFVYPYQSFLERGEIDYVLSQIENGFTQNFVSYVYEDICREKMWEIASANRWPFRFNKVGRYWGKETGKTDIVAIDTINHHLIVGECKYSKTPKGVSILNSLVEKGVKLGKLTECEDIHYIVFSKSGFSDELKQIALENPKITLIEHL